MTLDTSMIVQTVIGSLVLFFLKDNTSSARQLREEVIILKTQVTFINETMKEARNIPKMQKDIVRAFERIRRIEKTSFDDDKPEEGDDA
jgi:hypothetical protein